MKAEFENGDVVIPEDWRRLGINEMTKEGDYFLPRTSLDWVSVVAGVTVTWHSNVFIRKNNRIFIVTDGTVPCNALLGAYPTEKEALAEAYHKDKNRGVQCVELGKVLSSPMRKWAVHMNEDGNVTSLDECASGISINYYRTCNDGSRRVYVEAASAADAISAAANFRMNSIQCGGWYR